MDQDRDRMRALSSRLLRLHGVLLDRERRAYEDRHGSVASCPTRTPAREHADRRPVAPDAARPLSQLARRDFLNGVALTVGGALLSPRDAFGLGLDDPARGRASYPPSLTGLRGSHAGSFEVAHALRDGPFWATAGAPSDTGESYDLVVVGAGISGLAAAWYFRQAAGPSARILILDNHDDFGGHARRNEFRVGGRTLISYGGTFAIDSPAPYSAAASALVAALGVEVSRWPRMFELGLYRG